MIWYGVPGIPCPWPAPFAFLLGLYCSRENRRFSHPWAGAFAFSPALRCQLTTDHRQLPFPSRAIRPKADRLCLRRCRNCSARSPCRAIRLKADRLCLSPPSVLGVGERQREVTSQRFGPPRDYVTRCRTKAAGTPRGRRPR